MADNPLEPVTYRGKDLMIYKIQIGRQEFIRASDGTFEIPGELAEQADMQPSLVRVTPKT